MKRERLPQADLIVTEMGRRHAPALRTLAVFVAGLLLALGPAWAEIRNGPYLQQVSTDSVLVCWTTTRPEAGAVRFGADESLGRSIFSPKARSHQVRLRGLTSGARHYYQVSSGKQTTAVFGFVTAPPAGTPFSFAVYGDMKLAPKHEEIVARAVELEPAFVLLTGDLVEDGRERREWDVYFRQAAPLLARSPTYPSLGNHERDSRFYRQLFVLPPPARYYSFDYGDAHFVVLDSNPRNRASAAQRQWLVADLERHKQAPYLFALMHHPLYTCSVLQGRREDAGAMRRAYEDLFLKYRVSIVFAGHDHNYQHNVANGIHYVVSGGGGATLYPVLPLSFTQAAQAIHHLVQVEVSPARAAVRAILPDGEVLDEWEVGPRNESGS